MVELGESVSWPSNSCSHQHEADSNLPSAGRLAMTRAARMTTTRTFSMTIGTGVAAIVLPRFFNCLAGIHNAQTRVASTFHLSNSRHGNLLSR